MGAAVAPTGPPHQLSWLPRQLTPTRHRLRLRSGLMAARSRTSRGHHDVPAERACRSAGRRVATCEEPWVSTIAVVSSPDVVSQSRDNYWKHLAIDRQRRASRVLPRLRQHTCAWDTVATCRTAQACCSRRFGRDRSARMGQRLEVIVSQPSGRRGRPTDVDQSHRSQSTSSGQPPPPKCSKARLPMRRMCAAWSAVYTCSLSAQANSSSSFKPTLPSSPTTTSSVKSSVS